MHGPRRVVVLLSPTRQELVVRSTGGRVETRAHVTDPIDTGAKWSANLPDFQARLKRWVLELGVMRAPATVLYWSPDATASVHACAASVGAARAEHAALLAHAEGATHDVELNPSDSVFLFRDRREGAGPDGTARGAQLHHLVASDRAAHTSAVCAAVRGAGLRPASLVPLTAAVVLAGVATLQACAREPGVHAVVWVGEHHSVLAAGDADRLLLLRQLPLGTESLVEALSRPIRSGDGGTQCVLLDRATARRRLMSTGVPSVGAEAPGGGPVPDGEPLDPTLALPLLQPVLQRLALETRNSLRFGLGAGERSGLRVHLAGPGAGLRGLESSLRTESEHAPEVLDGGEDACAGVLRAGLSAGLNLMPREDLSEAQGRFVRHAMRVGVAIAGLAVAADAGISWQALRDSERVLATLRQEAAAPDTSRVSLERAVALQMAVAGARARLGSALAGVPEWSSVLAHIADTTPEGVLLTSLACTKEDTGWSCRISGVAEADDQSGCVELVRGYVASLGSAPVVARAKLGVTQRLASETRDRLSFEVVLALAELPRGSAPTLDHGVADARSESTEGVP